MRNGWIAVDWGTTNRRAFALDGQGRVTGRMADGRGILAVEPGGFPAAVNQIRARLGDLPMLLAGMIGSNRGWIEAPYVPCPAALDALVSRLVALPDGHTWIVPGVSFADGSRCDVMRGEEVQLLGAVRGHQLGDGALACHPGTHAKWARVRGAAITEFRTVMTGELFALLKKHSVLAPQLGARVVPGPAFLEGVDRSLGGAALTAELFSVRARLLIEGFAPEEASAFTSGLLVGADIRVGLEQAGPDESVVLIGDPNLTTLYAAALDRAGRSSTAVEGEHAFLEGMKMIAEAMP